MNEDGDRSKIFTSPRWTHWYNVIAEEKPIVSIQTLLHRWPWKPIRHCPGRFVLVAADRSVQLETLLGSDYHVQTFTSQAAKDTVLVVPFEDGGLISYARPDGSFVHTLNTIDGFGRKLTQLGIVLNADQTES